MENEKKILEATKRIAHFANDELFKLELPSEEYINSLISAGAHIIINTFTTVKKYSIQEGDEISKEDINEALDKVIKELKTRILE